MNDIDLSSIINSNKSKKWNENRIDEKGNSIFLISFNYSGSKIWIQLRIINKIKFYKRL